MAPIARSFEKAYPNVRFVGAKFGQELAAHYAQADVLRLPIENRTHSAM